jgi:superfamily I DNA/RNA helicase
MDFIQKDLSTYKVVEMKEWLKSIGAKFSLKKKDDYIARCEKFQKMVNFPWRSDQKEVLDNFIQYTHTYYCVNAIFGAGKTTLLLGMLIHGIIQKLFKPDEILFLSYNISIRNEIKRKLREFGISSKVTVRTFDSVIYEICKNTEYPYLDLPNFDGKRKHALNLCFNDCNYTPQFQPAIIFIDECQDLEKYTLDIIMKFYSKSIFFFNDLQSYYLTLIKFQ